MEKQLRRHFKSAVAMALMGFITLLVSMMSPPTLSAGDISQMHTGQIGVNMNGSTKRIVFETKIVVQEQNATSAHAVNKDDTGGPVSIYSFPPSLEMYPQVQSSNVIGKDGSSEAKAGNVPSAIPKVYPDVPPMDFSGKDDTGGPVSIYSLPPSLETYPQVQDSNVIGKDEEGGIGQLYLEEFSSSDDAYSEEVFNTSTSIGTVGEEAKEDEKNGLFATELHSDTVVLYEGFEGAFPGSWQVYGDPTWDDDDYKPYAGSWSCWCANGGSTGLDPATNNYANNMQAWAIYGPFSLSDASSGSFSFRYWGNTEQNYDYFKYLVSTNGTNFYGYQTSGDSGGWVQKSVDFTSVPTLGNVCGESQVWIAFKFDSDSSYTYKGSFVDEVYVQKSGTTQYPNLTPYQPSGWDGKIIVSNQSGTHSENTVYVGDTSYIDYAYINNGTADISQRFYSEFYINGSMVRRSYKDGLLINYYAYKNDFEYTFPSAGTYTLKLVVDVDNDVAESNENDNQYERTKSVGIPNEPNLTPYQPSGWDGKIIVSNQSGTHSENTVYVGDTSYIDYAYINNGTADISQRFYSEFYINGSMVRRSYKDGLLINYYAYKNDFEYTFPSAGTYTLKLVVDVDNDVAESNENDNQYERTKSVGIPNEPNLTPYQPSGWDGKIIVSNQSGTHSENTVYVGDTSYIDYAYINNGTADISQRFYSEFYINGSMVRRSYKDGLLINYYAYKNDFEYTFPSAGTYTLKLVVDVDNDVAESNENDNEYQRNKEINPHQGEPIIRIQPTSLTINQAGDSVGDSFRGTFVPVVEGVKSALQGEPRLDVIWSDENGLEVKLATPGMFVEEKVENSHTYKVIHLGRYNGELPPGQPNLPAIRKYVYVPKGKSANLEVTLGDSVTFTSYLVYPTQLPQLDTKGAEDPPFYRDEGVYSTDEWLPKEMVYLGPVEIVRGHTIRILSICPFQYNPAKKILRVFPDINVQMLFNGQLLDIDSRLRSPVFDRFIKGFVLNPGAFDKGEPGLDAYTGEDYLIITAPAFETQANALRDHKISRGITTGVVTTAVTGTTSAQIKDYIQNAYDTYSPVPTYVLLLGDVETIPTTYDGTVNTGTDLYYSTVDGTDYVADLFLGRISVDTVSEAQTVVNKIINYESNPPSLSSFYTNAAAAAYFQDGTPYTGTPDGYEDRRFVRTSEEVRDFLMGEGYNVQRIYCAESGATPTNYNNGSYGSGEPLPAELLRTNGFAWDGDAADISAAINGGVFLMMHRDHGMDRNDGYSHTGWGDPYYVETHIAALTNNDLLPVVMSINCQTGWFDGETDHNPTRNFESFCELFLRKSGGGAVGVFGATRSSYSGYNDFMAEGMIDCVWPNFLPTVPNSSGASARLGPMLNHGKLAMDQLWGDAWGYRQLEYELFHVFGDPSLEMYTTGGGYTFTIYNDGTADLEITSMTKRDGDAWLSWTPTASLTILPGGSQAITVSIDWGQVSGSSDDEQIIVYSNDDDMSPYPNAVFVNATKATVVPTVTTTAVSSITSNSAFSGGNVTNDGGAAVTARGVCWSTSANPTTSDSHTSDGAGTGSFTSSITGLSPNTTYHVRAYTTNSEGTGYGSDQTFTTTPATAIPTVTTTAVSSITSNSAFSGGNVTNDGGAAVTARGVCWSTSANPTTSDSHTSDGAGTGSFTSSITGLSPNTTYHVRAYATNSEGTGYGSDQTFTTTPATAIPTVTTTAVSSITSNSAFSGGNVTNDGGAAVTARGVCWSTSANPTTSDSHTSDGAGTGSFTSSITGLSPNTTYHVRAYATNSEGTGYGSDQTFTTTPATAIPTVTTTAVSSITSNSAFSGGNVTNDGGAAVTARGVCWSTSANPTTSDSHMSNGTGTGSFTSTITGLSPNTTYHVRAYATNSVGTGYGSNQTFTTTPATATKDELAIDFKTAGIYVYDAGIWNRIYQGIDPEGLCSFGTYLAADFGTAYGLYVYDAGAWTRVYKGVAIEKMAGFGGKLAVDFGASYPLYEYDFGTDTWSPIYTYSSPRDTIEALGDKLVVDFKTVGIYVYDAGIWNRIYKGVDPVNIVSFGDKLAIDFGTAYGLYVYEYDTDNWTRIYKGVAIEKMAEIDGDLAIDFGTAYGLYVYEFDTDNWTKVYKGVAIEKMAGFDGNLAVDFGTTYPIYEYDFATDNWNSIYQYSSPRDELVPANIFD